MERALSPSEYQAALTLWNYHRLDLPLDKADAILALGSHDLRVAERAARLWLDGWAPWLILTGGFGNFTAGTFDEPEADKFAKVAESLGVPRESMIVENQATNTGENIRFTRAILEERGLTIRSVLAVQKPFMERRALAALRKQWPEMKSRITSPPMSLEEFCQGDITLPWVTQVMVGDFQRILDYPKMGFAEAQEVPEEVMMAYESLRGAGFTQHLIGASA